MKRVEDFICKQIQKDQPPSTRRGKRLRADNISDLESSYRRRYYETIDSVKCRLNQRFAGVD